MSGVLAVRPLVAQVLSTAEIVKAAADKECLGYALRGACLWLHCDPSGCQVRSSPRIEHYLPDVVVLAYSERSPWRVERALHARLGRALALGGGGAGLGEGGVRFYQASVVGSPALEVMRSTPVLPLCSSAAQALVPYFLSAADSLRWRFVSVEGGIQTARSGRFIGSGGDVWGPLMPRDGFIVQEHATKAAAVIAQRAADIVVRPGQGHVYQHLGNDCGKGCSGPPPLQENSAEGGKWQRLYPSRAPCGVFGDTRKHPVDYGDGTESYAWHLWRPYRCCEPLGQKLLKVIEHE